MAKVDALVEQTKALLISEDGRLSARFLVTAEAEERSVELVVYDRGAQRRKKAIQLHSADPPEKKRQLIAEMEAVIKEPSWIKLIPYATEDDPDFEARPTGLGITTPRRARGEGWLVAFHEPHLLVQDERGRTVYRRAYPSWTPRITRFGQHCYLLTDLLEVAGNRDKRLLIVRVHSHGGPHFCDGVDGEHLVRVPK